MVVSLSISNSFSGSAQSSVQNAAAKKTSSRIMLKGENGTQHCKITVPLLKGQQFTLTSPEAIGSADAKLLFQLPRKKNVWTDPDKSGAVATTWDFTEGIAYRLKIIPFEDYIDAVMTIKNLTPEKWEDVWSFNCLLPAEAPDFRDEDLGRTYMSCDGKPTLMSDVPRKKTPRGSIAVYFHESARRLDTPYMVWLQAINYSTVTDDSWLVTMSEDEESYMAATSPQALFLFDNQGLCCIHSAPLFGDIAAGKSKTVTCRFFFAKGDLNAFVKRFGKYKAGLAKKTKLAGK